MALLRVISPLGRDGRRLCLLCHTAMPEATPSQDFCKSSHRALWHVRAKQVLEKAGLKPREEKRQPPPLDYDDPSTDGLTPDDYKYDDRQPGEL